VFLKKSSLTKLGRKRLLVVYIIVLISMIAVGLSRPAITFKIKKIEAHDLIGLKIGLITTAFFIFRALGATLSANIKNKKLIVTLGFFGFAFCLTVYNISNTYLPIILTKPLEGFLAGLTWPLIQLLVGVFAAEKWKITCMTIYFMMGRIGIQAGSILYGLINSIALSLFLASILMLISAFPVFKIYQSDKEGHKEKQKAEVKEKIILQTSPIYLAAFATGFNMGLVMELTLFYLNTVKNLSEAQTSILYGIAGLSTLFIPVIKGYFADVYSRRLIVSLSLLSVTLGGFVFSLEFVRGFLVLVPLIIYITGLATLQSLVRGLAILSKNPQKAIGYTNASGNIGAAISPIIGGLLISIRLFPFDSIFMLVGSFVALITLLAFLRIKI